MSEGAGEAEPAVEEVEEHGVMRVSPSMLVAIALPSWLFFTVFLLLLFFFIPPSFLLTLVIAKGDQSLLPFEQVNVRGPSSAFCRDVKWLRKNQPQHHRLVVKF